MPMSLLELATMMTTLVLDTSGKHLAFSTFEERFV